MVFPVVAPILGGLAAYLTGLGTKVADEVAMHPIKQGVKALYGDNKPKKQGLAQQMMAPQPQFQSSDPANALAGQLSMPQQQAQPQQQGQSQGLQQMTQAAEGAGGGLFGDYFSNADNPVRHGLGNAIASIIAINQGQNPFQTIEARNRSQLQRQQVKQQQEQYQQEQQQKQQQLQIDQQNRQEDIANRKSELQQNNAFKQQQFQYGQQQDQQAAQREAQKLQMEQQQFNAKMGIEGAQLKIQQQEADLKRQQLEQAKEATANIAKVLFPDVAAGVEAQDHSKYTPEQQQLLNAAIATDPSGKTALQMAAQFQKDANAPPTEAQSKARVNYDILERNLPEVDRTEKAAFQHGMTGDYALGEMPMDAGKFLQSKEYRQYQGAIMNWVQQLYFARSGQAAPESEVQRGMQIYAVQPWDDAVTAQNKVERRRRMVESLKMGMAPKSADPFEVDQEPQQQQIQDGATAVNPQTGQRIRLQGGQWVPVQ